MARASARKYCYASKMEMDAETRLQKTEEFRLRGVVVLPNVVGDEALALIAQYMTLRIATKGMPEEVGGPGALAAYADPVSESLLNLFTPFVASLAGEEVVPSFSYLRVYREEQSLPAHVDRDACVYTMTLAVMGKGAGKEWEIRCTCVDDSSLDYALKPGDGVLMRGREVLHWRAPLSDGWAALVFLHWVDGSAPRESWYDGRIGVGHPSVRHQRTEVDALLA